MKMNHEMKMIRYLSELFAKDDKLTNQQNKEVDALLKLMIIQAVNKALRAESPKE